ncbi:hypothetical protein PRIC1_005813 [Phytophthora ramorum]
MLAMTCYGVNVIAAPIRSTSTILVKAVVTLSVKDNSARAQRRGDHEGADVLACFTFVSFSNADAKIFMDVTEIAAKYQNEDAKEGTADLCGVARVLLHRVDRFNLDECREVLKLLGQLLAVLRGTDRIVHWSR